MISQHQASNLPPDFKEPKQSQGGIAFRVKRTEPLTDAEREAQAEAFAFIDEYDKRSRGQQFDNEN
jgi:hypothetical protein